MRIPRSIQLYDDSGSVHKYWQCHNRAFLLSKSEIKDLYLSYTKKALEHKSVEGNISLTCFCIMNNHAHMLLDYKKSSRFLSQLMRIAHSQFGYTYNKLHNKSGKVANERPKTPLIEDPNHNIRAHFYVEANPIRAGFRKLSNLHLYKYSSYGFYAFGIKTKWTPLLIIPNWYLNLGKTSRDRQRTYRKLFKEYLNENIHSSQFFKNFIGSLIWVQKKIDQTKTRIEARGQSPPK